MKKKILLGSIIAVAIIMLSSFSSVVGKVSSDNELVEFEVEFSGLGKKHTVKLTQQEADEVELLFDDIEQRLSEVETRDEAEVIFKEAVVELDKYGLLGGLSVNQAQKLIINNYEESLVNKLFKNQNSLDDSGNRLCLIAGKTSNTLSFGLASLLILGILAPLVTLPMYLLLMLFDTIAPDFLINHPIFGFILAFIGVSPLFVGLLFPIEIFGFILFGIPTFGYWGFEGWLEPKGFIFTIGLDGVKTWFNNIPEGSLIIGFSGIKITTPLLRMFHLGTALSYYTSIY